MGKKSKATSKPSRFRSLPSQAAKAFDPKASRIARLETADDAFGGDEDECQSNVTAIPLLPTLY